MSRSRTIVAALALLACSAQVAHAKEVTLLNVSYDPTRELYEEYNAAFAKYWQGKTATNGKLLPVNWQSRLLHNSSPYTSTIAFLVRKGNPQNIRDWGDLTKPGIAVVTPNPKTSGGARWNYLAGWAWALQQPGGSDATAKEYVRKLFKNVPVLDTGARGATTTFVQRGIGDVLLAWENEAFLSIKELGADQVQMVVPSLSMLAEPPVAVIDKVVLRRGTREVATEYLKYLYSPQAQEIIARNSYRPIDEQVAGSTPSSSRRSSS